VHSPWAAHPAVPARSADGRWGVVFKDGLLGDLENAGRRGERAGALKIDGREYQPAGTAQQVKVHDFPDKDLGKAIPQRIDDVSANSGWASIGTDHDASAFAVATLAAGWDPSAAPAT
jgi:Rhodopirellula transposase DDE domain